jgi:hypothetical protein
MPGRTSCSSATAAPSAPALGHALGVGADVALHFSVHNLGLTRLERHARGWHVVCTNEFAGV